MSQYKIERHLNKWLKVSYRVVDTIKNDWITSFPTKKEAEAYIKEIA